MKKENVILLLLHTKVIIAGRTITEFFCDLKHINYGWDPEIKDYKEGPARNAYREEDIVAFFEQLNSVEQTPLAHKTNLKSVDQRFVFYVYDGDKKLKMVVDMMKNKTTVVVTIH